MKYNYNSGNLMWKIQSLKSYKTQAYTAGRQTFIWMQVPLVFWAPALGTSLWPLSPYQTLTFACEGNSVSSRDIGHEHKAQYCDCNIILGFFSGHIL